MPIGFVTNCLGTTKIQTAVQVANELGFDCLEVGPTIARDRVEWKAVQQNGPIWIHSLIYGRNFLSTQSAERKAYRARLMWLIETALVIGVPQITTTTGVNPALTLSQNIEATLEFWEPIFAQTKTANVRIALEFCPGAGNFALGPYAWRKLLRTTTQYPNFGLNYDPSHLLWQFIDPYQPIREFRKHIFSVHAKDTLISRERLAEHGILQPYANAPEAKYGFPMEHAAWWEYALPGDGAVDWVRFLGELQAIRFQGALLIENEAREYLTTLERTKRGLKRALSNLRRSIEKVEPAGDSSAQRNFSRNK